MKVNTGVVSCRIDYMVERSNIKVTVTDYKNALICGC